MPVTLLQTVASFLSSDVNISQGSVATRVGCGGLLTDTSLQI